MVLDTRFRRAIAGAVLLATLLAAFLAPALAIFPTQDTTLSGPAINGSVPAGTAALDQSGQPKGPGKLVVQITNVAVPNGTKFDVILDRRIIGSISVNSGAGSLTAPVSFEVGRLSTLVVNYGNQTVLTGKSPWNVPLPTVP